MNAELRELALRRGRRRSSLAFYRGLRGVLRLAAHPFFRVRAENVGVLDLPGPTILAPVHRSNLDSLLVASHSNRRVRALGKQSLFTTPVVAYACAALGAIPVRRGEADRDALKAALSLLAEGESMIVFPEGGRHYGNTVGELFDGTAWLAAKSGARVVPIGIAGTEAAMPQGSKRLHRTKVALVVADPLGPPSGIDGRRVTRLQLQSFTNELRAQLQKAQDRAVEVSGAAGPT